MTTTTSPLTSVLTCSRPFLIDDLLEINIYKGTSFPVTDFDGSSDPYCIINKTSNQHDHQKQPVKTTVIHNCLNPIWNEQVKLVYSTICKMDGLKIQIMDFDHLTRDDHVGEICIDMKSLPINVSKKDTRTISSKYPNSKLDFEYQLSRMDPLFLNTNATITTDQHLLSFSNSKIEGLNLFIPKLWKFLDLESPHYKIGNLDSNNVITFLTEQGKKDETNVHIDVCEHVSLQVVNGLEKFDSHSELFDSIYRNHLQHYNEADFELVYEEEGNFKSSSDYFSIGKLFEKENSLQYYQSQYIFRKSKKSTTGGNSESGLKIRYFLVGESSGDLARVLIIKFATEHSLFETLTFHNSLSTDNNNTKSVSTTNGSGSGSGDNGSHLPLVAQPSFILKNLPFVPPFLKHNGEKSNETQNNSETTPHVLKYRNVVSELQQVLIKLCFD